MEKKMKHWIVSFDVDCEVISSKMPTKKDCEKIREGIARNITYIGEGTVENMDGFPVNIIDIEWKSTDEIIIQKKGRRR